MGKYCKEMLSFYLTRKKYFQILVNTVHAKPAEKTFRNAQLSSDQHFQKKSLSEKLTFFFKDACLVYKN